MGKVKIAEAIASVKMTFITNSTVGDKNFARWTIRSTGGGVVGGQQLIAYDHRPEAVSAAKAVETAKAEMENHFSIETSRALGEAEQDLRGAINTTARVVVMVRSDERGTYPYVNLYPTTEGSPTALFASVVKVGKYDAGFEVRKDNSFWSWASESSSRTRQHTETVAVSLTDDDHMVIIESYGYANIGHSRDYLTVIAGDIQQMTEEKYTIEGR